MLVLLIFLAGMAVTAITVIAIGMAEAADPAHGVRSPEDEQADSHEDTEPVAQPRHVGPAPMTHKAKVDRSTWPRPRIGA